MYIIPYQIVQKNTPVIEGEEIIEASSYWAAYWKARETLALKYNVPYGVFVKLEWSKIFY
jgi:hypothetical protein